jgi:hypothetical protein
MIDPKGFDQCVPTGIPVTSSPEGGGGGGGAGPVGGGRSGGGMFSPASIELSYNRTPELVVSNKPFVDYAEQLDAQIGRLLINRKDMV